MHSFIAEVVFRFFACILGGSKLDVPGLGLLDLSLDVPGIGLLDLEVPGIGLLDLALDVPGIGLLEPPAGVDACFLDGSL